MTKNNFDGAELHMGILQNRLEKLRGKMQICMQRITMKKENADLKEIDVESEELKFKQFSQQYDETDFNLKAYEEKVLELTKL